MPTLHWIGKDRVINRPYSLTDKGQTSTRSQSGGNTTSIVSKTSRQGIVQSLFYLSLLVCLLGLGNHYSLSQQLSPAARVSLITYGPGDDDISSAFGHTEIRIVDPILGIDQNYSYGGFNYRADWFILKFIQGTLPYYIDTHNINRVVYYYQQANRSIQEQALNLSPAQRQQLFAALEANYLPQNRYYHYKFYYDNCATRPRDMIAQACGDSLAIPSRSRMTGKSYRDWMNEYLNEKPWYQLSMNLALGYPSDEQTDGWQAMYLPDQLSDQLRHATLRQASGQVIQLVQNEQTLFAADKVVRQPVPFVADPDVVFTLFGILIIGFTIGRYVRGRKVDRWLDWFLFGISGFVGWFLVVLWLIRDDGVTAWNPTLLYLLPLHAPLVYWATGTTTTSKGRAAYFGITAGFILLGMYLSNIPGWFDIVYPLMLLVRCLVNCQPIPVNHQTPIQVALLNRI